MSSGRTEGFVEDCPDTHPTDSGLLYEVPFSAEYLDPPPMQVLSIFNTLFNLFSFLGGRL